jgi:hypothetical protein
VAVESIVTTGIGLSFVEPDAAGRTDEDGKARLTTFEADDGAQAGNYLVLISKDAPVPDAPESGGEDSDDYTPPPDNPAAPPRGRNDLPAEYGNAARSTLKAVVTAEGPNEYTFDLKD